MRLKGLDMNLLIVLDALLTERSVSLSAVSLNLGQSAVSAALGRLRQHFEDELLIPLNRQMVPTALAANLQTQVHALLQRADAIVHAQPEFDPRKARRDFVVLCSDYMAGTYIPHVIRRLAEEAPCSSLSLRPLTASQLVKMNTADDFERRGADFSILPEEFCSPRYPHTSLFCEKYCCVAWTDNADIGDTLRFEQFRELPHVAVQFVEPVPNIVESRLVSRIGVSFTVQVAVDEYLLVPDLIIGTQCIAVVPVRFAQSLVSHLPLRILDLPEPAGPIDINEMLQWNAAHENDPALIWFRNLMIEAAHSYEAESAAYPQ